MRILLAGGAFVGALVATGTVLAQPEGGFVLDRFGATPAGDPFFGVPSPATPGTYEPRGYVSFDYAHRPIRLRDDDVPVVAGLGYLRADVSFAWFERVLVDVQMPFALALSGEDPAIAGYTFTTLESPQLGDLRIGLRGRLWGEDGEPFQLGIGSYLFAPTGAREQYTGDGAVRGAFHALLGGRAGSDVGFIWGATGGIELRASDTPHAVTWGGAVGLLLAEDVVQLGAEVSGQTPFGLDLPLSTAPVRMTNAGTNAELLGGVKIRLLEGLTIGAAGGPGLGSAVGTPLFRMVGMVGWTPLPDATEEPTIDADDDKVDRDDDGIDDKLDACPDTPGQPSADPTKDGCPPSDRDSDGVPDAEDACPGTAGIRSVEAVRNGCPEDTDGDGVHDGVDKCPQTAGVPSDDPEMNGCAPDADRDRIADAFDACPNVAGPANDDLKANGCPEDPDGDEIKFAADACPDTAGVANEDPARNGCPSNAPLPGSATPPGEIEVGRHVLFRVTKFTMQDATNPPDEALVRAVREALARPDVAAIEVQGHTDDSGEDKINANVSQRRAETVRDWLVLKGIPADRLVVKAFSYTRPVADNRIRQGRDQNRRVQFVLIKPK